MKCCILSCKSYSDKYLNGTEGIRFHLFPSDEIIKQKWIKEINREDWAPTKYTKICSLHFNNDDVVITTKGYRRLKDGAFPSLRLDVPVKRKTSETTCDINEFTASNDTPTEKRLKEEIALMRRKRKNDVLKVRRLQMSVRRLKKKVINMAALIKDLEIAATGERPSSSTSSSSTSYEC